MSTTPSTPQPESIPIAIVGMACKLPGADNLEQYWQLLSEGRSAVVELPNDRLDRELYFDPKVGELGKCYSKLGALISSREFNHQNCPIPESLVQAADPVHLLMCEVAGTALSHAGYDPFEIPESVRNCGVFIGHAQGSDLAGDYTYHTCIEEAADFLRESEEFQKLSAADQQEIVGELIADVRSRKPKISLESPDVSASMVAGTIAKAFNLTGPYGAINSACASSLQSILLAVRALQLGRIDMAIAGGASDCKGDSLVLFAAARAMSSTGSRPFDSEADGLVVGEGYAAVVLKTLDRALADGDNIQAVVRGLGVSSDGKGKSLWAPRKEGQVEAMKRAYRAGPDISNLQYIEAHSTATQLGDATELNTLTEILSKHFPPGKKIPVTSVKANIGHSLETAGIASVIKAVLCMRAGVIPPAINIQHLNPKIDWETAPIYVPTAAAPWSAPADGSPRLAGINAFGIGGLNMHVAIEEFTEASRKLAAPALKPTDIDTVAVVGMGCILPGAANIEEYWQLLTSGRDPKTPAPADRLRYDLLPPSNGENVTAPPLGGFIHGFEYDWRRHKVPPKQIAQADPLQFMLLEAADQALIDAGYDKKPFDRGQVGVLVGTEFGGDFSFQLQMGLRLPDMKRVIGRSLFQRNLSAEQSQLVTDQFTSALLKRWPALIDETGSFSTSSLASRTGKTWNLMGGAAALDAGEASSLMAVGISIDMLLAGDCDMMICAAGQRRMGLPEYEGLAMGGVLSTGTGAPTALDARGNGFIPGEGVGVVLLKRLSDARRDGDNIRAIIRGVGAAHLKSGQEALEMALERSFQTSGESPDKVTVIEIDSLSRKMADEQLQAISTVQNQTTRRQPLVVGSAASLVGFSHGASGMSSLLKAILELEHGQVAATFGVEVPATVPSERANMMRIANETIDVSQAMGDGASMASIVSCGRGMAYHLICDSGSTADVQRQTNEVALNAAPASAEPMAEHSSGASSTELEAFLINFVVEQTGYPAEVVELDADLEADLGIDSIKKAQLFGELQEYFDVTPDENLTLDDFPTLRHVVKFLERSTDRSSSPAPDPAPTQTVTSTPSRIAEPAPSAPTAAPGPTHAQPVENNWRIIRFGADSLEDLQRQLTAETGNSFDTSPSSFASQHSSRVAIVADSRETLLKRVQLANSQLNNPSGLAALERQGIYFCTSLEVTRPRIAFLFPGQGSQYDGMLRSLVESHSAAANAHREVEQALAEIGSPSFAQMAWNGKGMLGSDAWATQASMMAASHIVNSVLRAEGINPEIVAGHSYGEYSALVATGAWNLATAFRVTQARCAGIDACKSARGGLVATSATPAQVHKLFAGAGHDVHVAISNAPTQTVIGGSDEQLEIAVKRLEQAGHQARKLPVPFPFHTPLMADSCGSLSDALRHAEIKRPIVSTFSLVTNREITSADDIRANLEAHMTRPQLYAAAVQSLAEERPTVFVEVGPQQTLTRLNEQILTGAQARFIASDNPKGSVLEQICRVRAHLECCGALDEQPVEVPTVQNAMHNEIVHFDATLRRTEKMRRAASSEKTPVATPSSTQDPNELLSHALLWNPNGQNGHGDSSGRSNGDTNGHSNGHSNGSSTVKPAEVSEPRTSDMWQVGEGFAVETQLASQPVESAVQVMEAPDASSSVDSSDLEAFLINFVVEQTGYPPEVVELDADLEADLGIDSIKKAQLFGELQEYFDVTPDENLTLDDFPTLRHVVDFLARTTTTSTPVPTATPAYEAASPEPAEVTPTPTSNTSTAELEAFLVNFVVEQTGYPPELVELDADLEADLGIDSIKKAQLFGELQEYFDVTPDENLTLDDFPTLRHVVDFLARTTTSSAPSENATYDTPTTPAPMPEPPVASMAALPAAAPTPPTTESSSNTAELEAFLVNFVVEQTGYPADLVELDADLEADLGIDSIKKAQLFGELQEYFDVTPDENLTLDDFPTLRHVVSYLTNNLAPTPATEESFDSSAPAFVAPTPVVPTPEPAGVAPVVQTAGQSKVTVAHSNEAIRTMLLAGSAYEMGVKHGQSFGSEIRRALYRLADMATSEVASSWTKFAGEPEQTFTEDQLAELEGIADAIQVPVANIVALNLAMLAELGSSSIQFAVEVERNGRTVRHGLRDERPQGSRLADCLVPVVQIRQPKNGFASISVTYAGCAGALSGLNAKGLAVTSGMILGTNQSTPQRHPLLTQLLLSEAADVPSALAQLQEASQSNSWNMVLSAADRLPTCIECTGGSLEIIEDKLVVAANHSKHVGAIAGTSADRLKAMQRFLTGSSYSTEELQMGLTGYGVQTDHQLCVLIDHNTGELGIYSGVAHEPIEKEFARFSLDDFQNAATTSKEAKPKSPEFAVKPYDLGDEPGMAERFVMRLVDIAWPPDATEMPTLNGPALVIGDNPSADALSEKLENAGAKVHRLKSLASRQAAVDTLEQLCDDQPVMHLFLMSSRDTKGDDYFDTATWQRNYESQVLAPFFLCQRWVQLASAGQWLDKCTLVALANCTGDFGFCGDAPLPFTGALTGLVKALYLEVNHMGGNRSFLAKAIDFPADEAPYQIARFICGELAVRTPDYEVSYVHGARYLQLAIPREADAQEMPENPPHGNWIVTGGARGITAECAMELGRRFGVKLHLLGTSSVPKIDPAWRNLDEAGRAALRSETILHARETNDKPNEAWDRVQKQIEIDQNLRAFADAGLDITYHTCNVADRAVLSRVLESIRREHGPIEGILHGAGIERSCRLEKKRPEDVQATFDSKVLGAWNLMQLTREDPIGYFIGFGSVSGRFGSNGQVDYCMASDMLCKLVSWYGNQRPSCHAVGFHWHPWDEVGMAYRPETRSALQNTTGLKLMPKREGLRQFLRELYAEKSDSEVLVTDRAYHNRFYPKHVEAIAEDFRTDKRIEYLTRKPRQIASRHVLRMTPAPLSTVSPEEPGITGPAFILGDNADALALRDKLTSKGITVHVLPVNDDSETTIAALESAWKSQPARNLFLLTARDTDASDFQTAETFRRRMQRGVYLPFQLTQRWFQLVSELPFNEPANLVAVTSLGGDFGFKDQAKAPESGALCGLLKSVYVEDSRHKHSRFRVKVIDSPAEETPTDLATAICAELASDAPEVEVSWSRGNRQTVTIYTAPIEELPKRDVPFGGAWVVTGGGRGITSYAACMLARRYGLKIHMIGKSPAPDKTAPWLTCSEEEVKKYKAAIVREAIAAGRSPEEDWGRIRKAREIEIVLGKYAEAGVETHYHSCDITDEASLEKVLDEIRRIDGPIQGVIHGAGYAKAARFESRVGDRLRLTFGPKADGTAALMRLTMKDPLRYFLAFGSLSGRYGGNGLSDYSAANEMLAKMCDWYRKQRPDCATTCFHWQTWDRFGMALLADAVDITKSSFKMEFMQPEEGIEHMIEEIRAGAPESEVLIADDYFEKSFYPYSIMCADPPSSVSPTAQPQPSTSPDTDRPLIDSLDTNPDGSGLAKVTFDPTHDPFLVEHLLKQRPFLPGVIGLETVLEAAVLSQPDQQIAEVRDVEIINGLMFRTDDPIATKVHLSINGNAVETQLTSEFRNRAGQVIDPNRVHVRAAVYFGTPAPLAPSTASKPALGMHPFAYSDDSLIYHGSRLRCLKSYGIQYEGGWGEIVAPPLAELAGPRSDSGWILPTAVLDACLVCCGSFLFLQFGGALEVPHGFEQMRWARQPHPDEVCMVRYLFRSRDARHSKFDFTLYGVDGTPILETIGYRTIRVGGETS
ncbi:type I polyketide synthase [Bythopirellula goksoeyrii]|uniref:Phenolphthiocerol synthesis polyketide synthase type I Pks15/1 n=1 Tax=Bythopirellula goksoeyrii TaxID=1400387 RepID=A0A5B9QBX3_9BACT|nr:type I polyketide synthase [Bythopirellula goksoeyrii]QEG35090.1 Phenolphthiocerol synthesis polyketide synthase type I Pks15/1 [Bythopirellula goksoeyrii]